MLYIENIDDCSFRMYGNLTTKIGLKVFGKPNFIARATEPQSNETIGRITIYDTTRREKILNLKPVSQITLDGTVYATAETFVAAFNNLMAECCCEGAGGDNADIITTINNMGDEIIQTIIANNCCEECDDWSTGTVESETTTFAANTIHSITIIVISGTVTLSNGTETSDLIEGVSFTLTATHELEQQVTIDATNGVAKYVLITCVTHTTTEEPFEGTTTTTEECELVQILVDEPDFNLDFPSQSSMPN